MAEQFSDWLEPSVTPTVRDPQSTQTLISVGAVQHYYNLHDYDLLDCDPLLFSFAKGLRSPPYVLSLNQTQCPNRMSHEIFGVLKKNCINLWKMIKFCFVYYFFAILGVVNFIFYFLFFTEQIVKKQQIRCTGIIVLNLLGTRIMIRWFDYLH